MNPSSDIDIMRTILRMVAPGVRRDVRRMRLSTARVRAKPLSTPRRSRARRRKAQPLPRGSARTRRAPDGAGSESTARTGAAAPCGGGDADLALEGAGERGLAVVADRVGDVQVLGVGVAQPRGGELHAPARQVLHRGL